MQTRFRDAQRQLKPMRVSYRAVLLAELGVLLLAAVVITVMPQEALAACLAAAQWAYGLAIAFRPAVALAGLLTVCALAWAIVRLSRQSDGPQLVHRRAEPEAREPLHPAA